MVAQTFGPSDVRASAYEPLASRVFHGRNWLRLGQNYRMKARCRCSRPVRRFRSPRNLCHRDFFTLLWKPSRNYTPAGRFFYASAAVLAKFRSAQLLLRTSTLPVCRISEPAGVFIRRSTVSSDGFSVSNLAISYVREAVTGRY